MDEPLLTKPPGDAELLWVNLTAFGPASGWQDYRGPPPTSKSDWLRVPNSAVITHSQDATPIARWVPTEEGDLVAGSYLWDSEEGFGIWHFVGSPVVRYAIYPELPPGLVLDAPLTVDPNFAFLTIDVVDYNDLEGYDAVMGAGRAHWPASFLANEAFLRAGGAIASATTYADL